MDNPWENAWGDHTKPKDPWTAPVTVHNELDDGLPAWSSKAVHWTESAETVPAWGDTSSIPSADDDDDDEQVPEDTLDDDVEAADSPAATTLSPSPSPPASPDAFGTFESALEAPDVDPWTPSQPSFTVSNWEADSSWKSPKDEPDLPTTKADEWETAIRQKEKQDQFVPPELLASILQQFQELSKDMWPSVQASEESLNLHGVEDITELASSFQRFIPQDLMIPPTVEFSKTFTSKRLAESLKLTRHASITQQSPFSRYASSKGSTSWEASVKARPELQDDLVPAGWRMVSKEHEVPVSSADTRPKAGGGLLSFFGRRASTPPVVSDKSPTSPVTKSATDSASSSPRPSTDTGRTSLSSIQASVPVVPSPLSPTTSVASSSSVATPTTLSLQPVVMPPAREATPPPSAVSRFLNRFSRTKSATSPRNSLALSSDDLEFLSDIVPSASDEHEDLMGYDSHEIKALTGMIGSSPLPTKLPPPLAPPPRAPPPKLPQKTAAPVNDLSLFFDGHRPEPPPTLSATSMNPSPAPSFGDSSPTQHGFPSAVSRSITPVVKPTPSPAMPPMSPFTLPSPTGVNGSGNQYLKKVPTVIMSSTASRPPSVSQLQSAFTLPPPPTSRERTPVLETAPPLVHINTPIPRPPPQSSASLFDDDDFADFSTTTQSPPRQSSSKDTFPTSYVDNSFTSVSSDQSLFSSTSSTRSNSVQEVDDEFDDFDEFVSPPTLRTPSPPAPPAKTSLRHAPPPKIDLSGGLALGSPAHSPPIWQAPPPKIQKISRAAEHQRTLSLMETAASRQWPLGPPSPLPPVLQPPGGGAKKFALDIFGSSEDTMQEQQMKAMAALPASTASVMRFSGMQPTTTSGKAQTGGLSAQDLSFFEGL